MEVPPGSSGLSESLKVVKLQYSRVAEYSYGCKEYVLLDAVIDFDDSLNLLTMRCTATVAHGRVDGVNLD